MSAEPLAVTSTMNRAPAGGVLVRSCRCRPMVRPVSPFACVSQALG